MKKVAVISLLFICGALNLSATKAGRLKGKWRAYKMTHNGETRDMSEEKKVPWIEFADDNLLWVGEGKKDKKRGEWWLDDDNKTIHLIIKNRDRKMIIERLSKKKLVTRFKDGRSSNKAFWKKAS
jgi:uncharacterized protein (TIGR03067 family)